MLKRFCRSKVVFLFVFNIGWAHAQEVSIPLDLVKWEYQGDHFYCELNQKIKNFGGLTFIAEPSHAVRLKVESSQLQNLYDQAGLFLLNSPWISPDEAQFVSHGEWTGRKQVVFDHDVNEVLQSVAQGGWTQLQFTSSFNPRVLSVDVPSVNIEEPLRAFNRCRESLPALSYKQARDVQLAFALGQRVVSGDQRLVLNQLAEYIRLDQSVSKVLVDGHTDNVGSSLANLQIARVRADDVASVLEEAGVDHALIETRAHGDRYPVANNQTEQGQAKNRRVTIRVIRRSTNNP
ncbi:OmpA family protein [Photobacterium sp. MCCC 1A19761]|uniref:MotY family protein n=1 Tax=Photobacterium sp. MCCC 1A19761 TaxID=3115000 RepID=UPI00307CE953